jgi:hypothetical protein
MNLSEESKRFTQDFALGGELALVTEMLVMAAAAASEIGAGRRDARGGGLEDAQGARLHNALRVANGLDLQPFSGKREGNQHGAAPRMSERRAAVHEFFSHDLEGQAKPSRFEISNFKSQRKRPRSVT